MDLIGMLDSPYVRRVAITAQMLGIDYVHRSLSVFRNYEEIRAINPLVKVPTLVCDDGEVLVDSTLIIDYLESVAPGGRSLMPADAKARRRVLQLTGIALMAMEKTVQHLYETRQRPQERQYQPWIERIDQQLAGALQMLADAVGDGERWLLGPEPTQADISIAVALRFTHEIRPDALQKDTFPGLHRYSERAEALPAFLACPFN
ncbi:MAG: glutathione S-transferase family protein [Woeseiaceae bacterium]|nr:glutathione S-transferase family protein [Woeseiaceae bacterium]